MGAVKDAFIAVFGVENMPPEPTEDYVASGMETVINSVEVSASLPPKSIIPSGLTAADIADAGKFDGSGLGVGDYLGWAIVNGQNGTPSYLNGRFVRHNPAGAGTTGGSDSSAHTHAGPSHAHAGPSHTHTGPSHVHTMPTHKHTMPGHIHAMPSHKHTMSAHYHGLGTAGGARIRIRSTDAVTSITSVGGPTFTRTHVLDVGTPGVNAGTDPSTPLVGNTNSKDPGDTNLADPGDTYSTDPGDTNLTDPGDTNAGGTANTGAGGTANTGAGGTADTGAASVTENRPAFADLVYLMWLG